MKFPENHREYHQIKERLFAENDSENDNLAGSAKYAVWLDSILCGYFEKFYIDDRDSISLFALGSYGRSELNPFSDIDILIVHKRDSVPVREKTKQFIQGLWDFGLEVGHQFVTPQQCCELALEDAANRTTILEMRLVCGSKELSARLELLLNSDVYTRGLCEFSEQLLKDTASRHQKYGGSPQLLEPHVKEGVGGLRDLHVLLWLFRVSRDRQNQYVIKQDHHSSIMKFLQNIRDHSLLLSGDAEKLKQSFRFLMKVRNRMHLSAGRKNDHLEYGGQKKLAADLGYRDQDQWLAVEHFMRDYYTHTRRIYHTYLILSEKLARRRKSVVAAEGIHGKKISDAFYILDDEIHLHPEYKKIFYLNPPELLLVFIYRRKYNVRLSEALRESIYYAIESLGGNFKKDKEVIRLFLQLFKYPEHLGDNLRTMHELGLLDVILPEFSALTSLAQHDLYHFYSADEHTLIAIENLTGLAGESPAQNHLARIYAEIRERRTLLLSILFHDLGKARQGDHTIVGVEIAGGILRRWGIDGDESERILFLVRNHQKMEQIAFRRNVEEFSTIREFAHLIKDEKNLKLLYLLSYADLSAVNPNIWTEWKGILLMELFNATQNYLHGKKKEGMIDSETLQNMSALIQQQLPGQFSEKDVSDHLREMPPHYPDSFDEKQIAGHLRMIRQLATRSNLMKFENTQTHFMITTITRDQLFCLADICGVLSIHDLNIFSAQIFTRRDLVVVDVFRVIPISPNLRFDDIQQEDISQDLEKVLSGSSDLPHLFQRHKRKWKRRKFRHSGFPDEINFDNSGFSPYTIIDIFTDDSVGLLYRLALAMSELHLNIRSAKISTRVDQVADSFYVVDQHSQPVLDEKQQAKIRQHLLKAIHREF